jgi:Putative prokaryotic signal transducing protein
MTDSDLVVVHSFGSQPEADLARSALEAAGIDALIKEDSAGGMRPSLAWAAGYEVFVRAEDVQAARDVLDLPATPAP